MFLKSLDIIVNNETIRNLRFQKGINFIVDETPSKDNSTISGNNVGKTTVLKLINFCLGGNGKEIYTSTEDKKTEDKFVKEYLVDNNVKIVLKLKDDLENEKSNEIEIIRNFISKGKKKLLKLNGINCTSEEDFKDKLKKLIFSDINTDKPSFKQLISHNIRYSDLRINNTLKILDNNSKLSEYQSLYLSMLGLYYDISELQLLNKELSTEMDFKNRLEKEKTKNEYETILNVLKNEIQQLEEEKSKIGLREDFQTVFSELKSVKEKVSILSTRISNLDLKKSLIEESISDFECQKSDIDAKTVERLYNNVKKDIPNISKKFEELLKFHNLMIIEHISNNNLELKKINDLIKHEAIKLNSLLEKDKNLSDRLLKSKSYSDIENLVSELNTKYEQKGQYETSLAQIKKSEEKIAKLNANYNNLNKGIMSEEFEELLKKQRDIFNGYFSAVSSELYNESSAINYEIKEDKKTKKQFYDFSVVDINMSSGKKQGEILCFDIAYILFADNQNIKCLHFLLNDKKELMHSNQLINVSNYILDKNVQLVLSILEDKLPDELKDEKYYVVKLSQDDKLFRIEGN